MATYSLIEAKTLTSSAASVTFSAIPATYTDLAIRISARNTVSGSVRSDFYILPNSETTSSTLGSYTAFYGIAGTSGSGRSSNTFPFANVFDLNLAGATANTFSSVEIYIPSYTAAQNKPVSNFGASENNTANDPLIGATAQLFRSTSAITQLSIVSPSGSFVSDSSFYLYGISNA
jgi:hypothetical protein